MVSITSNPTVPAPIRARLARLRRAVALWLWIDGLSLVVAAAVVLAAASLLVDRSMRLDRIQRALSLAAGLAVLSFLAYRRLARPLFRSIGDDALSRMVERRHPELGESLLSAVEFARMGDLSSIGCSGAMVRAAIDLGVARARAVDFADTLDSRRRRQRLLVGLGAAAVLAAAFALFPGTMGLWLKRNVFLSDEAWPQRTHLEVLDAPGGRIECPRGDDLTIQVRADPDGVVPSVVMLDYKQSSGRGSEAMVQVGGDLFRTQFRSLVEPMEFRASGGDARTGWHEVRLVERPIVDELALACTPPAYVAGGRQTLPANVDAYPVLVGSTVEVSGRASKDLARAGLVRDGAALGDLELTGPRSFRTTLAGEALKGGAYMIALRDAAGLVSRQPARFSLKVVPDRQPVVRAHLEGIGDLITPQAVVPLACKMNDDYAVQGAEIVYTKVVEEGKEPPAERLPLGAGTDRFGRRDVEIVHRLEAAPLALEVGSRLVFRVEARDNDTVTGPKVGTSGVFSLKVVTSDELRAELLRREQEQRMEFERLLRDQQGLLEDSRAALAGLAGAAVLPEPARAVVGADEKRQRLIAGRLTAVADQFARILAEVENNRLEDDMAPIRVRLQDRIIEPQREMARRGVVRAADLLDAARKHALSAANGAAPGPGPREALAGAADEQQQLVAAMREVLKNMVKWEGYQEAVTLLREVLKAQKQVSEETVKEYQRRIRSIFEDEKKP